jgi:ribose transport system substrate-binding protein
MGSKLYGWLLAAAVLVAACGGTSSNNAGSTAPIKIDFASADDAIGVFKTVSDGMVAGAPTAGVTVRRYDNKLDGATALANADLMIADHPDVIVDWNAVANVGAALGQKFANAKIPCLAANQPIPGCAQFNLSNMKMGVDAANVVVPAAIAKGWTSADTTIMMVVASPNGVEVNNGPRYFYITAQSLMPGYPLLTPDQLNPRTTVIGNKQGIQFECLSTIEGAYNNAKNILPTIPASKHIMLYGSDSDCAEGPLRAMTEAGRQSNVLTCGLGPTPDGLNLTRTNSSWLCEGSAFLDVWAEFLIAEAVAIKKGIKVPALSPCPQLMLTKQNIDTYYTSDGKVKLIPFPSEDQYLVQTGILQKFHNVQGVGA